MTGIRAHLSLPLFAVCLLVVGCSDAPTGVDSGVTRDAGGMDGGASDGGGSDAGGSDAGTDAGESDDAGESFDAGGSAVDAGPSDAGAPDAARPDAGMCMDARPGNGRPVAYECSACRPPGSGGITRGDCMADSDCTSGDNGRCINGRIGGSCSYDECFKDDDCMSGELCACDGGFGGGNACITASCRLDSECGGYECSPTLGSCGHYFPPVGYYCHSAADACQNDGECATGYCAYNETTSTWACSDSECVG